MMTLRGPNVVGKPESEFAKIFAPTFRPTDIFHSDSLPQKLREKRSNF
jgi:hypothetical protein